MDNNETMNNGFVNPTEAKSENSAGNMNGQQMNGGFGGGMNDQQMNGGFGGGMNGQQMNGGFGGGMNGQQMNGGFGGGMNGQQMNGGFGGGMNGQEMNGGFGGGMNGQQMNGGFDGGMNGQQMNGQYSNSSFEKDINSAGNSFGSAVKDVGNKFTNFADKTWGSTKAAAHRTKLKGDLNTEIYEINKAYVDIGTYYFNKFQNEPAPELSGAFAYVEQARKRIADLETQINNTYNQQ